MRQHALLAAAAVWLGGLGILAGTSGCVTAPPEAGFQTSGTRARTPSTQPARPDGVGRQPTELPANPALSDYLAYAALHNRGLEAAFNRWKAAIERIPQVRAMPDPRLTYRYFIQEVETRVGAQRQGLELGQVFPWFGKLSLRGDAAAEAASAQRERFESARLRLFYRVRDAYHEYYYLGRAVKIVDENARLVQHFERVARTRYKTAAASHPDVIRAQVELGKLADRLSTLKDLQGPIVARLNAALNRPTMAPLPWPESIDNGEVAISDQQLLTWLAESNPHLKALAFEIARSKRGIALAKKEYFPDVMLGVGWIDTARSTGGRHPSDDGKDPLIGSVSVNLPIWRDKLAAGVREARYRHLQAVHSRAETANALGATLKLVLYRFRDAERKIDLYRDTLLPKARQSVKATEASFRAGKGSFLDLIDAERVLLEFALARERAQASRLQRLAELEMIVGRAIPRAKNR